MMFTFSLTFLFLLLLLQGAFYLFVDDFYVAINHRKMIESANDYPRLVEAYGPAIAIERLSSTSGFQVNIIKDFELMQQQFLKGIVLKDMKPIQFFETEEHLIVIKKMTVHDFLVLIKPMGLAQEATGIFQRFMVYASLGLYLIGSFFIYLFSKRISQPLKRMNEHTKSIAQLSFQEDLEIRSEDELGELANSINIMSNRLNKVYGDLKDTLEEEREMERLRRQFVSHISHELKNPLTMIQGYAEGLVKNKELSDEKKLIYGDTIFKSALRMNKVLEELLDLSAFESGSIQLHRESVNLLTLIQSILEDFELKVEEKQIRVQRSISPVQIIGDELRLNQLFRNLIENAIKYVDEKGFIKITLSDDANRIFRIENTGPLMSETFLKNIWDSFRQEDSYHEGYGLGLAISKKIAELHDFELLAYKENELNVFELKMN